MRAPATARRSLSGPRSSPERLELLRGLAQSGILVPRALEPVERPLRGGGILHRERRLEQDARIARLALKRPVLLRERERLLLVPQQGEVEARLFLLVELVAPQRRRLEARPERLDVLARLRGFRSEEHTSELQSLRHLV